MRALWFGLLLRRDDRVQNLAATALGSTRSGLKGGGYFTRTLCTETTTAFIADDLAQRGPCLVHVAADLSL
jgi:hypothetical protein